MDIRSIFYRFSSKKTLLITALLIIAAIIPFTVFIAQKQQEIRQRAAGEPQADIYFTDDVATPSQITTLQLAPGQTTSVRLYIDVRTNDLSGFDVSFDYGTGLTIEGVDPGAQEPLFDEENYNVTTPTLHFAKAQDEKTDPAVGKLHIATLRLKTAAAPTTGSIVNIRYELVTKEYKSLVATTPTLAYTIAEASPTPTGEPTTPSPTGEQPTATPQPTAEPSVTPTQPPPTPTQPAATPTPSGPALTLTLRLGGIGKEAGKNDNPRTKTPTVEVLLFDQSEQPINTGSRITGNLTYGDDGLFRGTVYVGTAVQPGTYLVKVKTDRYLVRLLPGLVSVPGTVTSVPELVAGNINGDDRINILDYEALRSCFEAKANTSSCSNKTNTDLNDDEVVDLQDYKLLFQAFTVQKGD